MVLRLSENVSPVMAENTTHDPAREEVVDALCVQAEALVKSGNVAGARVVLLEAISAHGEDAKLLTSSAAINFALGEKDAALEQATKALTLDPSMPEVLHNAFLIRKAMHVIPAPSEICCGVCSERFTLSSNVLHVDHSYQVGINLICSIDEIPAELSSINHVNIMTSYLEGEPNLVQAVTLVKGFIGNQGTVSINCDSQLPHLSANSIIDSLKAVGFGWFVEDFKSTGSCVTARVGADELALQPAQSASAPAQVRVPASSMSLPEPAHDSTPTYTKYSISDLVKMAVPFHEEIEAVKRQMAPEDKWYPYHSLTGLQHLDRLLTGERRNLLALAGDQPIADIGCADGDTSFFFERLGATVDIIDNPPTNFNAMNGIKLLKEGLKSNIDVYEMDIDRQFIMPRDNYGLVVFLGILYHLKNPYYAMETISKHTKWCLVSTKITKNSQIEENVEHIPMAYLLDPKECNNDSSNYWVFTSLGLKRLFDRTGWIVEDYIRLGDIDNSHPSDMGRDERAFALLRSKNF